MDRSRRRLQKPLLALALLIGSASAGAAPADTARWKAQAARVSIVRDEWGVAHVRGRSDADAVFGGIYAQAEDDFARIEANYLTALGRTAEAKGEAAIWQDLRQRLYADPAELQAQYRASPPWLRRLMDAWADGLNFYLATHPGTRPAVLTRFEPWMALSFTEGSIGSDIERISPEGLAAFYGGASQPPETAAIGYPEPQGSNGIAIAPSNTIDGHALLLINPHTSFYFRAELQMTSDEGLDVYGAATWGQFFIYQGFNAKAGWMHTSSGVDNVDEFAETIVMKGERPFYRYGRELRPVRSAPITIRYRKPDGTLGTRSITAYRTHHGPIVRAENDRWIAQALMWKPIPALEQSFLRTKQTDLASYLEVADRKANSSNDTLFADAKGEIAYLHPQFVPIRDDRFDYRDVVDGADPATDWRGLHALAALPSVASPKTGWVYNTNDEPWNAAGPDSAKKAAFPRYMDSAGPNPRGTHAVMLLQGRRNFTPERLRQAAYDSYLPEFAKLLPMLFAAYDALPQADAARRTLAEPIALLKGWDYRWSASSEATALAAYWGDSLLREPTVQAEESGATVWPRLEAATPAERIAALQSAMARLTADFGGWRVQWGEINRFQRLDDAITPHFDDAKPSTPVPFASAIWGSLASFGAKAYPYTKRWYGSGGNSFVAIVEFGPKVRAWAVTAGGASGDPASPHFADQIGRYASGDLRPVHFDPADVTAHAVKRYRPGELQEPVCVERSRDMRSIAEQGPSTSLGTNGEDRSNRSRVAAPPPHRRPLRRASLRAWQRSSSPAPVQRR